jgi:hypothetical protein
MLKRSFFPCCVLVLLLLSCSQHPVAPAVFDDIKSDGDLKNTLVGTWISDAVVVGIDTINNTDLSVLVEINQGDWKEKLHLQPIQTIFNKNKTYVSAYCTTDGKIIRVTAGKWKMEKNRLNIHQLFPNDKQMNYRIDLEDGFAQLKSNLDFDGDGNNDDIFYCQMKKVGC